MIVEYVVGVLLVVASLFALTAAIGIVRLPDIYSRMHAASKAGTLGSCVVLLALAIHSAELATVLRALAGIMFFLFTAPLSAHLLAKAAHVAGHDLWSGSVRDDYRRARNEDRQSSAERG
jgi:multicomponent Na+:H+ antiporter subunit G